MRADENVRFFYASRVIWWRSSWLGDNLKKQTSVTNWQTKELQALLLTSLVADHVVKWGSWSGRMQKLQSSVNSSVHARGSGSRRNVEEIGKKECKRAACKTGLVSIPVWLSLAAEGCSLSYPLIFLKSLNSLHIHTPTPLCTKAARWAWDPRRGAVQMEGLCLCLRDLWICGWRRHSCSSHSSLHLGVAFLKQSVISKLPVVKLPIREENCPWYVNLFLVVW